MACTKPRNKTGAPYRDRFGTYLFTEMSMYLAGNASLPFGGGTEKRVVARRLAVCRAKCEAAVRDCATSVAELDALGSSAVDHSGAVLLRAAGSTS